VGVPVFLQRQIIVPLRVTIEAMVAEGQRVDATTMLTIGDISGTGTWISRNWPF